MESPGSQRDRNGIARDRERRCRQEGCQTFQPTLVAKPFTIPRDSAAIPAISAPSLVQMQGSL